MAFCRNCGQELTPNSRFCGNCGSQDGAPVVHVYMPPKPAPKPKTPYRGLGVASMILGIVSDVYVGVMGMVSVMMVANDSNILQESPLLAFVVMFTLAAMVSMIMSGVAMLRGNNSGQAKAGIITGTIAFVLGMIVVAIYAIFM